MVTPEITPENAASARACALAVVRRVFEEDAWADRALHGEAKRRRLDRRDRALATRLAYGTVQRKATLDALAEELTGTTGPERAFAALSGLVSRR